MAWRLSTYFLWLSQKYASNLNLMTKWKTYLVWMQNCKRCFTLRVAFYIVHAGFQPPSSTTVRLLPFWYLSNRVIRAKRRDVTWLSKLTDEDECEINKAKMIVMIVMSWITKNLVFLGFFCNFRILVYIAWALNWCITPKPWFHLRVLSQIEMSTSPSHWIVDFEYRYVSDKLLKMFHDLVGNILLQPRFHA